MKKFAVVYFLKENLRELNDFRKKYQPNYQIIPPHITLVSPISGITENQFINHIKNVTKQIQPFSIHLHGLVKTTDHCLFLLVKEGNEEIQKLHALLYSGVLASFLSTEFSFTPHITIGEFEEKDRSFFEKAYKEAQEPEFDIISMFDSVSIIVGDGITPAKIITTIALF